VTPSARKPTLIIRAINTVGRGLARFGIGPGRLELEALLEQARVATGLEDFGLDEFRVPLTQLLADIDGLGRDLTMVARLGLWRDIPRSLRTRLRTQELLRRHGEIREQSIVEPIFIIGSQRTGTTMLHNLLSHAPGLRAPLLWELLEPAPRFDPPNTAIDPRMTAGQQMQAEIERVVPELFTAHPMIWDWPEECLWLLANSFLSEMYLMRVPAPDYRALFLAADWSWAIEEYVEALQLLAWQRKAPARWLLKAPGHMFRLREIAARFPDARFIRTHRDPRATVASTASLLELSRMATCPIDPHVAGREVLELWFDHGLGRFVDAADELDPSRCFDVDFRTLMTDPFGTVERMFDHFGLELGDQTDMRAWLARNPRHSRGQHRYELDRYGISEGEVLERTARYRERFAEFL
jgi:hypothetical protein